MTQLKQYTSDLTGKVFIMDENNDLWASMWLITTAENEKRAAHIVQNTWDAIYFCYQNRIILL